MNDEVKEILIDLIDYYNAIGTKGDPGFEVFAKIASRSSKALEREVKKQKYQASAGSGDIDPFANDVIGHAGQEYSGFPELSMKYEEEW